MPVDYSKYPKNWKQIKNRVLRRAGGRGLDPRFGAKCETCGVEFFDVGYWSNDGFIKTESRESVRRASAAGQKVITIQIGTAHLHDPDPMNCADDNLGALCRRCHNRLDAMMRSKNRAKTRKNKQLAAGQQNLL
ncbi:MAG: hypothetical protein GY943_24545 [Chloroflexi bacterium]|nr:hypothetical protein [Chloroflexota bacterium]